MLEDHDNLRGKGIHPEHQRRPARDWPQYMQQVRHGLEATGRVMNPLMELKGGYTSYLLYL
jgi:hypothetical protein